MEENVRELTIYERSAIIGYYRNGMDYLAISLLTGINEDEIKKLIEDYLKYKKETNEQ